MKQYNSKSDLKLWKLFCEYCITGGYSALLVVTQVFLSIEFYNFYEVIWLSQTHEAEYMHP